MNSFPRPFRSFRSAAVLPVFAASLLLGASANAEIIINELDADQPGTDIGEFIELYDGGVGNTSLTGYFLVLFNGNGDRAYLVIDLAGMTTSPTGYFVVGNSAVPTVGIVQASNFIQNGSDTAGALEGEAVALCTGTIGDIVTTPTGSATPVGSIPATITVVDAVVYDAGNSLAGNDATLLAGFGMSGQNMVFDSSAAGASSGRPTNGGGAKNMAAWAASANPTPGGSNSAVPETLSLSFLPSTFDESDGAGASTGTVARTGPTAAAVTVALTNPDPSELVIPATVVIPAGAASAPFTVDAVNDAWNDGTQVVSVSAAAPGFTGSSANVTVNDEGDPAAVLVVNEVHATGRGDANGDGTNAIFGLDEFVEIVNVSASPVDLSGWTLRDAVALADNSQIRHTFPANLSLSAGCAVIVFGGGNPIEGRTAAFGNAWIVKANGTAVNGLSLNDTGDVVSLQNPAGDEQAGVTYGAIAAADNTKSLNRNPDLTGPNALVVHTNVPGSGTANYSPGTKVDGAKFCTLTESFTVTLTPNSVVENSGLHSNLLTISRPAPGTSAVQVTLTGSDPGEAVAATGSLAFGPGVLSMNVSVTAVDDELLDGTQSVTFTAMGEGYLNGTGTLSVTDDGTDIPLTALYINELDCDQAGTENLEFIELYDGGIGNKFMDGFIVVLYNGNGDVSYLTLDLTGKRTNAQGYFVIGSAGVPGVGLVIPDSVLQNGADAVAIHQAAAAAFPNGTAVTATGLIDAVVYGTSQADDTGLLAVLTPGKPQALEGTDSTSFSLARRPDAATAFQPAQFTAQPPTPGLSNVTGSSYPGWAAAYPGLGGPNADDDFDGLPNRLEFGLGTNPLQPNASGIPTPAIPGGQLRFTLNKGLVAGNDNTTQFVPEVSTDLVDWSGTGVTIVTNNSSTLVFDYTGPSPRVMMRARVVVP